MFTAKIEKGEVKLTVEHVSMRKGWLHRIHGDSTCDPKVHILAHKSEGESQHGWGLGNRHAVWAISVYGWGESSAGVPKGKLWHMVACICSQ